MGIVAFSCRRFRGRCRVWVDGSAGSGRAAVQLVDLHQVVRAETVALTELASALFDGANGRVAVLK